VSFFVPALSIRFRVSFGGRRSAPCVRQAKDNASNFLASLGGQPYKVIIKPRKPKLAAFCYGNALQKAAQTFVCAVMFCSAARQVTHESSRTLSLRLRTSGADRSSLKKTRNIANAKTGTLEIPDFVTAPGYSCDQKPVYMDSG